MARDFLLERGKCSKDCGDSCATLNTAKITELFSSNE